jgi:hypothetical protein
VNTNVIQDRQELNKIPENATDHDSDC